MPYFLLLISTVLCFSCALGQASSKEEPPLSREEQLEKAMTQSILDGTPGISLYVQTPEYLFYETMGYADIEAQEILTPSHLFRIYSTSKSFIGVLSSIAHMEGVLDLNEAITSYLPAEITSRIPNSSRITPRHLLSNQSGIYDVGRHEDFDNAVRNNPYIEYTPLEILEFIYHEEALFEPGTAFDYSNTNFILMGLILDHVYQDSYNNHAEAMRAKIFEPLNLTNTFYEDYENYTNPLAHGYTDLYGEIQDTVDWESEYGHAFGGILSTTEDVANFFQAVVKEDSFPIADRKQEFLDLFLPSEPSGFDPFCRENYGLGIMQIKHNTANWIQHGGGGNGYQCEMYYFMEQDITISILINSGGVTANGSSPYEELRDEFIPEVMRIILQ